jgi:hypothetical protein
MRIYNAAPQIEVLNAHVDSLNDDTTGQIWAGSIQLRGMILILSSSAMLRSISTKSVWRSELYYDESGNPFDRHENRILFYILPVTLRFCLVLKPTGTLPNHYTRIGLFDVGFLRSSVADTNLGTGVKIWAPAGGLVRRCGEMQEVVVTIL